MAPQTFLVGRCRAAAAPCNGRRRAHGACACAGYSSPGVPTKASHSGTFGRCRVRIDVIIYRPSPYAAASGALKAGWLPQRGQGCRHALQPSSSDDLAAPSPAAEAAAAPRVLGLPLESETKILTSSNTVGAAPGVDAAAAAVFTPTLPVVCKTALQLLHHSAIVTQRSMHDPQVYWPLAPPCMSATSCRMSWVGVPTQRRTVPSTPPAAKR